MSHITAPSGVTTPTISLNHHQQAALSVKEHTGLEHVMHEVHNAGNREWNKTSLMNQMVVPSLTAGLRTEEHTQSCGEPWLQDGMDQLSQTLTSTSNQTFR